MSQDGENLTARVERLEAWVETAMRTLAGLGLEDVLCELDEARGQSDLALPEVIE